jgi:large subunit ribosomal protein L31
MKKNLHPKLYNTNIFCNNELILVLLTTKKVLNINIWSGNHSFYNGSIKNVDKEKRIEKFEKKYIFIKK